MSGLTTTIRDGVTGHLVPEGDPTALAERLTAILADPAEHRWPCVAESVCRLYADLRPAASIHLDRARCLEL